MSTFYAYSAFNYTAIPEFGDTATMLNNTSTQVQVQESNRVYLMEGTALQFVPGSGFQSGVLSHIKLTTGGATTFEMTGTYDTARNLYDNGIAVTQNIAGFTVSGGRFYAMAAEAGGWLEGNDTIYGSNAADRLAGFGGRDKIYGKAGNDRLEGWSGNDMVNGGSGHDTLFGGSGNDSLYGGSDSTGNDVFVFSTPLNASTNLDLVYDFGVSTSTSDTTNNDCIHLDDDIFTTLGKVTTTTALAASRFAKNTDGIAMDSSDRIIYDTDSGALYYDPDGNGAAVRVQFASIVGTPDLRATDFFVIS